MVKFNASCCVVLTPPWALVQGGFCGLGRSLRGHVRACCLGSRRISRRPWSHELRTSFVMFVRHVEIVLPRHLLGIADPRTHDMFRPVLAQFGLPRSGFGIKESLEESPSCHRSLSRQCPRSCRRFCPGRIVSGTHWSRHVFKGRADAIIRGCVWQRRRHE